MQPAARPSPPCPAPACREQMPCTQRHGGAGVSALLLQPKHQAIGSGGGAGHAAAAGRCMVHVVEPGGGGQGVEVQSPKTKHRVPVGSQRDQRRSARSPATACSPHTAAAARDERAKGLVTAAFQAGCTSLHPPYGNDHHSPLATRCHHPAELQALQARVAEIGASDLSSEGQGRRTTGGREGGKRKAASGALQEVGFGVLLPAGGPGEGLGRCAALLAADLRHF